MNRVTAGVTAVFCIALILSNGAVRARGQDENPTAAHGQPNEDATGVTTPVRPFSATKYARLVRVLPDGKLRFLKNERYPTKIAKDVHGRIMVQFVDKEQLSPECDQPQLISSPPCPSWTVAVVDPVKHTISHWTEGERGAHVVVDMPIASGNLDRAIHATSDLREPPAGFGSDDGDVRTVDLGSRAMDGVVAHGVRTTLEKRDSHRVLRIHEVWIAAEMKLIVRVVDGDPNGIETVWGLEKISLHPDPALFEAPAGYDRQQQVSDAWAAGDFEQLETWYEK